LEWLSLLAALKKNSNMSMSSHPEKKILVTENDSLAAFKKYNFQSGRYALLVLADFPANKLGVNGDFYIDDIAILEKMKKEFTVAGKINRQMDGCNYHSSFNHMFYHYNFILLHKGNVKEHFFLNIDSNLLSTGERNYEFDPLSLVKYKQYFKKLMIQNHSFNSLTEAKAHVNKINSNKRFLYYTENKDWKAFDGSFAIEYITPDRNPIGGDTVKNWIDKQIRTAYPTEPFKLAYSMLWNGIEYGFTVECNKSLFDQFSIYNPNNWKNNTYPMTGYYKE
jgi:hypothetical protein